MRNQVLSIKQMRLLQVLGVDTSKASMSFEADYNPIIPQEMRYDCGCFTLNIGNLEGCYPTFTLQDIIEMLPPNIGHYTLEICKNFRKENLYSIGYNNPFYGYLKKYENDNVIDAAYEMLFYVIDNGYLK